MHGCEFRQGHKPVRALFKAWMVTNLAGSLHPNEKGNHMRYAYEDVVNEKFIRTVGVILAQARDDGTDAHDYIDKLVDLYETTIDELPEPYPEDV